jgi:hypothetical protein
MEPWTLKEVVNTFKFFIKNIKFTLITVSTTSPWLMSLPNIILCFDLKGRHKTVREPLCYNRKVAGSISNKVTGFISSPKPSSRTMTLGSTQSLIEMSTRNIPGGKGRPASKADNLTAICEPTV